MCFVLGLCVWVQASSINVFPLSFLFIYLAIYFYLGIAHRYMVCLRGKVKRVLHHLTRPYFAVVC